jgi:protein-tyrosine phosphatase
MPASKKTGKASARSRAKGPSEIAPGVFVGGWNDAVRFAGARFCVLDEAPEDMPPAMHIPIYDATNDSAIRENLDRLAQAVASARTKGEPALVFCGHGVRRGPLGGAWYLRKSEGLSLDEAYERVRAVRPKIEHARAWVGNAKQLEAT